MRVLAIDASVSQMCEYSFPMGRAAPHGRSCLSSQAFVVSVPLLNSPDIWGQRCSSCPRQHAQQIPRYPEIDFKEEFLNVDMLLLLTWSICSLCEIGKERWCAEHA